MKRTVEILEFTPERVYQKQDGTTGYGRSIVVQWFEEGQNGRYEQSTVLEVSSHLDEGKLLAAKQQRAQVEVGIYFGHSEYQNKWYPRTRGYLPQEFMAQ